MATKVDKPSKWADKLTQKLFKGKKGKAFREQLLTYLKTPNPPLGVGSKTADYLLGQIGGPNGLAAQTRGLLDEAVMTQQGMLPAWQNAVNQGLSGNFFDIGPAQAFAERGLHRETLPAINQSFATLGSPLSSDTTGQITGAVRDTYLDLAAQDALMEFQAKNALVNQGGLSAFMQGAASPLGLAQGTTNQFQQLAASSADIDAVQRAAQQSTLPGAASLFPSFLNSGLEPLSQISSRGRTIAEV